MQSPGRPEGAERRRQGKGKGRAILEDFSVLKFGPILILADGR
jgi:hypothetical protein